jgi:hypothetical protein
MLNFLEKYNQLPQEIRDKMSTPAVMSAIDGLEKKYGVSLAALVMKIMTKEVELNNIVKIQQEIGIDEAIALDLIEDLKEKVFANVADYLGFSVDIAEEPSEQFYPPEPELPEEKKKRSNFLFSLEDEDEIKRLAESVKKTEAQPVEKIAGRLDDVIAKSKINFGSDELKDRFKQIITTYLRGIRSKVEIKQALTKPFISGGLGFDEALADNVVSIADGETENKQEIKIQAPEKIKTTDTEKEVRASQDKLQQVGARDIEYNLAAELKKKEEEKNKVLAEIKKAEEAGTKEIEKTSEKKEIKLDLGHELAPPPPAKIAPPQKIKVTTPKKPFLGRFKSETRKTEPAAKPIFSAPTKARITPQKDGKVKMEDVKPMPKTMSPVDELKYLDLTNFRRLGDTPADIIKEIKDKLDLLESENYAKRLEGIKAWRISPVNKLYLDIGQKSISENKAIDDIIEKQKGESLTKEEFDAIMDLNRILRF